MVVVDVSRAGAGGGGAGGPGAAASAWVVLVADPVTGETDAFGPFDETSARRDASRRQDELRAEGLAEVLFVTVPLTPPDS